MTVKSAERNNVVHTLEPIFDRNSKVLVLGTMPSPKSREHGFYYGHPQNNFWPVLAKVFDVDALISNPDKKQFLLENHIALWDVLKSCDINGADDGSIKNPIPNDISQILYVADIKTVYTTGMAATKLYKKLCYEKTGVESVYLPSTSPANRKYYNFDDLVRAYSKIKNAEK